MFQTKLYYLTIIVITLYCDSAISQSPIEVRSCSDDIPKAVHFTSEGCTEPPCPVVKGKNSNADITFRITADTETSDIKIRAKPDDLNLWVPYPAPDKSTCHGLLNSYCPLDENEIVTYNLAIPILSMYPAGLTMDLEVSFLNDKKEKMMCMRIKIKVVEP